MSGVLTPGAPTQRWRALQGIREAWNFPGEADTLLVAVAEMGRQRQCRSTVTPVLTSFSGGHACLLRWAGSEAAILTRTRLMVSSHTCGTCMYRRHDSWVCIRCWWYPTTVGKRLCACCAVCGAACCAVCAVEVVGSGGVSLEGGRLCGEGSLEYGRCIVCERSGVRPQVVPAVGSRILARCLLE